ncbi:MAG: hypothetical protein AAGJ81_08905 [Verrucomicrobiota bacterium]
MINAGQRRRLHTSTLRPSLRDGRDAALSNNGRSSSFLLRRNFGGLDGGQELLLQLPARSAGRDQEHEATPGLNLHE